VPTPGDMKGRAALVTGAASGLGRATALKLAQAGADLCIVDINAQALEETAEQAGAHGGRVLVRAADLADADTCAPLVAATVEEFGRLDALCNVAGIVVIANTPDMSKADYDRIIAVNLSAPFHLIQAAIPHLLDANGAIVNVTSQAAFFGHPYMAAYCASKAGLTHLTKALAMEYIRQPIRINAVAPGGMQTNMTANMSYPDNFDGELFGRVFSLRGMVEPEDVAELIAFLASPAARGYHGACISLDAGITAG
jgi:NAD(P)-dependent dehydrogenase (short-subunit alcohol dehydrogenase family)